MASLTITGSPTFNADSSCILATPARIQAPVSLLSGVSGWSAFRVKFTNNIAADSSFGLLYASDGTSSNVFELRFSHSTGTFRVNTIVSAASDDAQASNAYAYAAADVTTVVLAWTSTQVKCSIGGAGFTTFARARTNPPLTTLDLLSEAGSGYFPGRAFWIAIGSGPLTDADAATINAIGSGDPSLHALPGTPTFLWPATDAGYFVPPTLTAVSPGSLTVSAASSGSLTLTPS